ncbi:winged helix-turn-helix domain-containing protein [Ectothiorhodospiraceae bacterium WFHF3C12]|nr:winged helix-turn-helix domain-containing protein [Ectothiorhodospiraceae bacterium WFHF3C12]
MAQRMSDLLASQALEGFVGRAAELEMLRATLSPDGPRVVHVHGIAGIGKTALLERFAAEARSAGATVIRLDCRDVEPTEPGLLQSLGEAVGGGRSGAEALATRLGDLGSTVVLALDTYEVFRLLDTWLRQVFLPMLPENVRVLFFGRQRPLTAWHATPGWGRLLKSLAVEPLTDSEAGELLAKLGVDGEEAAPVRRSTHGHPLALMLAAGAVREERREHWPEDAPLQHALDELTRMFLADVGDPVTRRVIEGAAVTRRVTVSLLRALFPDLAPQDAFERLRRLPFVDGTSDGLIIHDAVREAIARSLRASDPSRHLEYRRAAWHRLTAEAGAAGSIDLWRYTADMLYLIENPVVREAFFPSGTPRLPVERAHPGDEDALTAIIHGAEGGEAARVLLQWWRRMPQAFSVVRSPEGRVIGLCCKLRSDRVEPTWLLDDPVTAQWYEHLRRRPMARNEVALFCRRWLSEAEGDSPSEVQAAVWLDLKRTYMELRPDVRRVYLVAHDLPAYASVAQRLGFEVLAERQVTLDGRDYHSAVLDFGPSSVDGWLAEIAAAELGVQHAPSLLDVEARELALEGGRVPLTPLEFGVMHHLQAREDKAVSRSDLLRDVWGTTYEGGSNVVDAVVRTLRRKLGDQADRVETVTGVGYRLRSR